MSQNYIQAPTQSAPVTYRKGKVKRIKRTKRNDVPEFYRKKTLKERFEFLLAWLNV